MNEKLTYEMFEEGCKKIVQQIKKDKFKPNVILTFLKGGALPAVRIAHLLNEIPVVTNIYQYNVTKDTNVLIIDDVSDTGKTLLQNYPSPDDFNCRIATLYKKPNTQVTPDYYAYETDKWIDFWWEEK